MKIVFRYRRMKSAIVGEIKRPVAEVYIRAKSDRISSVYRFWCRYNTNSLLFWIDA